MTSRKKIKSVRGNKRFPKIGWIQSCYYCLIPTSQFMIVEKKKVYSCKSCQKNNN